MPTIIFTGRFQPLHMGHIHFLEAVKRKHPKDLLLLCVIRNTMRNQIAKVDSTFHQLSQKKQTQVNNPLPNCNRYRLLSLAVQGNDILKWNTEIVFRNRSDVDWDESVVDLPKDRIWVFPKYGKEAFDKEKVAFYQSKRECIEIIEFYDDNAAYSATTIRNQLKEYGKNADLSFLPNACREYFCDECMEYFFND